MNSETLMGRGGGDSSSLPKASYALLTIVKKFGYLQDLLP